MPIDYRTDIPKHYVRKKGWLPACRSQAQAIRNRSRNIPLRYFTFCAAEAIDVFMLEQNRVVRRSGQTGRLEGIFFCEKDEAAFGQIADLIGSPEQGFQGEFERIVLFEDDADTEGRSIQDDEPYEEPVRKKLRYKDAHARLRASFPFDIINLDVYGNMFPPNKSVIARLLSSIIRILEWQTESLFPNDRPCQRFTLFLTCYINPDRTDGEAIRQLTNRLSENIETNSEFRAAFDDRYGHQEAGRLASENFAEFFSLAVPKYMIHLAIFQLGWSVSHGPTYLYNRPDPHGSNEQYQMMHSVSVYERIPDFQQRLDAPSSGLYSHAATGIINDGAEWIEAILDNPTVMEEIEKDLADVVEFADRVRLG
jgi:hypothetical protein